jgi:hypothetical protein
MMMRTASRSATQGILRPDSFHTVGPDTVGQAQAAHRDSQSKRRAKPRDRGPCGAHLRPGEEQRVAGVRGAHHRLAIGRRVNLDAPYYISTVIIRTK